MKKTKKKKIFEIFRISSNSSCVECKKKRIRNLVAITIDDFIDVNNALNGKHGGEEKKTVLTTVK